VTFEPDEPIEQPILPQEVAAELEQIVVERDRRRDLEIAGLVPTRTALLTGPPGVGKTLSARYLAHRLGLPLHRVDLSLLMSSYLGKTGQNLRAAIIEARETPSVLLVDEFDAIAKRRDDPGDVGELKRIVNVLLLELEEWPSTSLLIAATNHPELLDRAIWRRFERVITIDLPNDEARRAVISREILKHGRAVAEKTLRGVSDALAGYSASDLVTLVRAAVRRAVLSSDEHLDRFLMDASLERLLARAAKDPDARLLYSKIAHGELGMSQREIALRLNVTHVTVGRDLKAVADRGSRGARRKENGE
jgi:SpoVK/Ycf46/Vps4 family AAA+-type ATPase